MQLTEQYRPTRWTDVVGQEDAVAQIQTVLRRGWGGRAWWITGPSGTGKTTLAKLIANEGASDMATEELEAGSLTPAALRDMERRYACRPLPIDGKTGWCLLVNECHKLRRDTVTALLDVLERLPNYVVWVFTTTKQGQASFFADDEAGDTAPLVSRCHEIELANGSTVRQAMAARCREIAQREGIDGLAPTVYAALADTCQGNMRRMLQRIESGAFAKDAAKRALLEKELAMLASTKGERAESRRAELKAALAK